MQMSGLDFLTYARVKFDKMGILAGIFGAICIRVNMRNNPLICHSFYNRKIFARIPILPRIVSREAI